MSCQSLSSNESLFTILMCDVTIWFKMSHCLVGLGSIMNNQALCLSSLSFLYGQTSEEGSTISCVIERTRGVLDHVYVNYTVTQLNSDSQGPAHQDFANASGSVLFLPGQRSEVLNLLVLNDDTPEFAESFQVTLVSAESGDGKPGSTPTSGASINPDNSATSVTVMASDHPYGAGRETHKHTPLCHPSRTSN
uniref:Calx-beta domain-containing protein n=1 Tax=Hucho hucho TaxID=62062 RepID=A0A4W5KVI3_9TELE